MSDGLKNWIDFVQMQPLIQHFIQKATVTQDCKTAMKLVTAELKQARKKRLIVHICMELLQNISHHALRSARERQLGLFCLNQDADNWYIMTQNQVAIHQIAALRQKLEQVNAISNNPASLKSLYCTIITADTPISKNAGLGIVDIVRKSKQELHYNIEQLSAKGSNFTIMATINK